MLGEIGGEVGEKPGEEVEARLCEGFGPYPLETIGFQHGEYNQGPGMII